MKPAAAKGGCKGKKAAKPAPSPTALPLDLAALDASQCPELVRLAMDVHRRCTVGAPYGVPRFHGSGMEPVPSFATGVVAAGA
eukprot:1264287-Prymnesium_polylepis.1